MASLKIIRKNSIISLVCKVWKYFNALAFTSSNTQNNVTTIHNYMASAMFNHGVEMADNENNVIIKDLNMRLC